MKRANRLALPEPMDAPDALLEDRRVPRQVHVDHGHRVLEVQADAAGVEELRREGFQTTWAVSARPEPDEPLGAVVQDDLAVAGPEASAQDRPRLAAALEPAEDELDVLAGAEQVRREVWTTAVVVAGGRAADRAAIGAAGLGIGDQVVGEDRLRTGVPETEPLFAAELPPQFPLPHLDGQVGRLVNARECSSRCRHIGLRP
jgi:hypothetical protein